MKIYDFIFKLLYKSKTSFKWNHIFSTCFDLKPCFFLIPKTVLRSICKPGCGILAADETPLAMADRFKGTDNQIREKIKQI